MPRIMHSKPFFHPYSFQSLKKWFETKEKELHGRKASLRAEMRPEWGVQGLQI